MSAYRPLPFMFAISNILVVVPRSADEYGL
jgi:hypothetical protein